MSKFINVWEVRHDEDAETLTFQVVCDQEVGDLLLAISRKDTMTKNEMGLELSNLLERSIHLNLPRSHRFWRKNRER
tara:strand:- start:1789 stop:2019 length:231 start_codon:yes stop_codon:yes gene_type:complete